MDSEYSSKTSCSCNPTTTTTSTSKSSQKPPQFPNSRKASVPPNPATNTQRKLDVSEQFRPDPSTVLDYNISQDDIKLEKTLNIGRQILHIQQTTSKYEPLTTSDESSSKTETKTNRYINVKMRHQPSTKSSQQASWKTSQETSQKISQQTSMTTGRETLTKTNNILGSKYSKVGSKISHDVTTRTSQFKTCSCETKTDQKSEMRQTTVVSINVGKAPLKMITSSEDLPGKSEHQLAQIWNIPATSAKKKPDIIAEFRPKPRTVADYHISQTDMKFQRSVPAGFQQFHIKTTAADYVPFPPGFVPEEEPKLKHGTGGGPCWVFTEEILEKRLAAMQERYKKWLVEFIKRQRRAEYLAKKLAHEGIMRLVGPDWFQELSPNQLDAIDALKAAILKDVKTNSIGSTQDIITQLGLVLPPKPRQIRMALNQCCQCPVEFLLVLYQLINKNRKNYSLNDRLLLSSVVHLTIRETLKELHVRIPSPSRSTTKKSAKKKKHHKKKKRVKYSSPYLVPFTFVPEPPKHTGIYENRSIQYPDSPYFSYLDEMEIVFTRDLLASQKKNVNPAVLITEKQIGISQEEDDELMAELRLAQLTYNDLCNTKNPPLLFKPSIYIPCDYGVESSKGEEDDESSENQTNVSISVNVKVTTDLDQFSKPVRKVCEYDIQFDEKKVPRHASKTTDQVECTRCESTTLEVPEIPDEKVYVANTTQTEGDRRLSKVCLCKEKSEIKIEEVEVELSEEEKRKRCPCNVSIVQRRRLAEEERKRKLAEQGIIEQVVEEKKESETCVCKAEVEKLINAEPCQCDKCKEDRGEVILKSPTCDCLKIYQKRVKTFEDIKKRFDEQRRLIMANKFLVFENVGEAESGSKQIVENSEEPRRRSQSITSKDCKCMKLYKAYFDKHTPCIQAYDEFLKKVKIDVEEYMADIAADERYAVEEVQEVEEELPVEEPKEPRRYSDLKLKCPCGKSITTLNDEPKDEEETKCPVETFVPLCCQEMANQLAKHETNCCHPDHEIETETNLKIRLEINMDEEQRERVCTCYEDIDSVDIDNFVCPCNAEEDGSSEELGVDIASELKRFIILEEMPTKYPEQLDILKKCLEVMADDGFPLAKLPDVEKLPIFKLWMKLRCKKMWTQQDRIPLMTSSKSQWRHTDKCFRKVKKPDMQLTHEEASKYTWLQSSVVKRMVREHKDNFYRKVKEANIGDGREFFPTMYTYELPRASFRRCYFAYVAGKPVDCIASGLA